MIYKVFMETMKIFTEMRRRIGLMMTGAVDILERYKRLINCAEENLSPTRVEASLNRTKGVTVGLSLTLLLLILTLGNVSSNLRFSKRDGWRAVSSYHQTPQRSGPSFQWKPCWKSFYEILDRPSHRLFQVVTLEYSRKSSSRKYTVEE